MWVRKVCKVLLGVCSKTHPVVVISTFHCIAVFLLVLLLKTWSFYWKVWTLGFPAFLTSSATEPTPGAWYGISELQPEPYSLMSFVASTMDPYNIIPS